MSGCILRETFFLFLVAPHVSCRPIFGKKKRLSYEGIYLLSPLLLVIKAPRGHEPLRFLTRKVRRHESYAYSAVQSFGADKCVFNIATTKLWASTKIVNHHKSYEPTQKLWTITKIWTTAINMSAAKIINRHKNNERSQKLWTTTKAMNHHKIFEPSQKLWAITKIMNHHKVMNSKILWWFIALVVVHNFCDRSLFLWRLIIFVALIIFVVVHILWWFIVFVMVHKFFGGS